MPVHLQMPRESADGAVCSRQRRVAVTMGCVALSATDRTAGQRVRRLRTQAQISQSQLAAMIEVSGSYLSLIESGRRPATPEVLQRLASALGCTPEHIQTGRGGPDAADAELELRFAEVALRAGDAAAAMERFCQVEVAAEDKGLPDLQLEALWGQARSHEAVGDLESAIEGYEALTRESELPTSMERPVVLTALCRAYHECGDLTRAVEIGERALQETEQPGRDAPSDDATIALASTLVGCYFERGDLTRAHILARSTLTRADDNGSPQARAAALWNAGLVCEARGDLRTARLYIERALALYGETDHARRTGLLKVALAWLLLREEQPDIDQAEALLARALDDLPVDGSTVDVAYAETELARCHLLRGDWSAALRIAEAVVDRLAGARPRLEAARARILVGDSHFAGGSLDAAVDSYAQAAKDLQASGAQRQAAAAWRELAERLVRLGRTDEALNAYRAASDALGLPAPTVNLDRIKGSRSADPVAGVTDRPRQRSRR